MSLFKKRQPVAATINDKAFACLVCGNDRFWDREVKLNSTGAELLDVGWANQSATRADLRLVRVRTRVRRGRGAALEGREYIAGYGWATEFPNAVYTTNTTGRRQPNRTASA